MKRKNRRSNCEKKEGTKISKPFRGSLCWCNREAQEAGWVCDLVCEHNDYNIDDCWCSNSDRAGLLCERGACWHKGSGQILCTNQHWNWKWLLSFNLTSGADCKHWSKTRRPTECNCANDGTMKRDGNCECKSDYSGLLCNEFKPQPQPQQQNTALTDTGLSNATVLAISLTVPVVAVVILTVALVLLAHYCQRRRKRKERLAPWIPSGALPSPGQQNPPIFVEPIANEPSTPPIERNVEAPVGFESQPRPIFSSQATPISGSGSKRRMIAAI